MYFVSASIPILTRKFQNVAVIEKWNLTLNVFFYDRCPKESEANKTEGNIISHWFGSFLSF